MDSLKRALLWGFAFPSGSILLTETSAYLWGKAVLEHRLILEKAVFWLHFLQFLASFSALKKGVRTIHEKLCLVDSWPFRQAKKAGSTRRASQAVPHPSTDRALRQLTAEFGRDPVYLSRYGRRREHYIVGAVNCRDEAMFCEKKRPESHQSSGRSRAVVPPLVPAIPTPSTPSHFACSVSSLGRCWLHYPPGHL